MKCDSVFFHIAMASRMRKKWRHGTWFCSLGNDWMVVVCYWV